MSPGIDNFPRMRKLSKKTTKMFSKFKLQKPSNVIYRQGARQFEAPQSSNIVSIPLLEHYDQTIRALRAENQMLKSQKSAIDVKLTMQYNELVKACEEAFQLREEMKLLRDEVAHSRLKVDQVKNQVKFNTKKKKLLGSGQSITMPQKEKDQAVGDECSGEIGSGV